MHQKHTHHNGISRTCFTSDIENNHIDLTSKVAAGTQSIYMSKSLKKKGCYACHQALSELPADRCKIQVNVYKKGDD